jgi:UPF0176 protein
MAEPEALVAALYHFAPVEQPEALAAHLRERAGQAQLLGTLLVAREGINGTVSGAPASVHALLRWLRQQPGFASLEHKESRHPVAPFKRLKVRIKNEVVTMRSGRADPRVGVGKYVQPEDWNALVRDPDVVLIDVRNAFEVAHGSFDGARDPGTTTFGDFPSWLASSPDAPRKDQKVAMFCTGGIRCERATAYMVARGYADVSHLKGGILNYLAHTPPEQSTWRGDCFVFDERVALGHDLRASGAPSCPRCSWPLRSATHGNDADGPTCPRCDGPPASLPPDATAESSA